MTTSWVEFNALTTPTEATSPSAIVSTSGPVYRDRISASTGHTIDKSGNSTLVTTLYGLQVQRCKPVAFVMAAGVLAGSGTLGDGLVDRALLLIAAVLGYRNAGTVGGVAYTGADGSFPAHKFGSTKNVLEFHNKVIALDRIAYALLLFRDSEFNTGSRATTYTTLLAQFETCALWAATPDIDQYQRFFRNEHTCNRTLRACAFFEKAGVLLANQTLRDLAENLAKCVLGIAQASPEVDIRPFLSPDGVLREEEERNGIGFDAHYQNVSLDNLADISMTVPDGTYRTAVLAAIALGRTRWQQAVNTSTGLINAVGSTRSKEVFPRRSNVAYYGGNAAIAWSIHLSRYVLGGAVVPATLADKVIGVGQGYTHAGPDGEGDDEPLPLNMIILDAADAAEVVGVSITHPWRALRPIARVGGGACAAYPGGTLPDPVSILPESAAYAEAHAAHGPYLRTLPVLDVREPGFPAAL